MTTVRLTRAARFRKLTGWEWEIQEADPDRSLVFYSGQRFRLIGVVEAFFRVMDPGHRVRVINTRTGKVAYQRRFR